MKISNLATFACKSATVMDPEYFREHFTSGEMDPLSMLPLSSKVFNLTGSLHTSVHFDPNVALGSEASLRFIKCVDQVYPYGTVCRLSFQKLDRNGEEQVFMILKGIQRAKLLEKVNEEEDLLLYAKLESQEMKIKKDTKTFSKLRGLVR